MGFQHVNVASQLNDPNSLFHTIQKMVALRKRHPAFGSSDMEWLQTGNSAVAVYVRKFEDTIMLIINNLSNRVQQVQIPAAYQKDGHELFSGETMSLGEELELQPYRYHWLQL